MAEDMEERLGNPGSESETEFAAIEETYFIGEL